MRERELIETQKKFHCKINGKWTLTDGCTTGRGFKSFSDYTGFTDNFGENICYNTPSASIQLELALILSEHLFIQEALKNKNITDHNFDFLAKLLIDIKVLKDMKILDFGCGYIPTFARCARKLGGTVYTIDIIPADEFKYFISNGSLKKDREMEIEHHIKEDISNPKLLEIISQKTEINFDLVTSAMCLTGGEYKKDWYKAPKNIKQIAFNLLKKGGVYHCNDYLTNQIEIKK